MTKYILYPIFNNLLFRFILSLHGGMKVIFDLAARDIHKNVAPAPPQPLPLPQPPPTPST